MNHIEKRFEKAMFDIYYRAKSEANYRATLFLNLLMDRGGLATAQLLINAAKPSDGYTNLYERGRLDLTVEALIVENTEWHSLFSQGEIDKAKKRLGDYGYFPHS